MTKLLREVLELLHRSLLTFVVNSLSKRSYITLLGELHARSKCKHNGNKCEANVECLLVNTYFAIVLLAASLWEFAVIFNLRSRSLD